MMTPYFDSFSAFLAMDGHGFYVWTCYALVFGSVLFGVIYTRLERKKTLKRLAINQARQTQRQAIGENHE